MLEFGGKPTSEAAAYAPGVCRAWAADLADALTCDTSPGQALQGVQLQQEGRVKRHRLRGNHEESKKEQRRREDQASQAGMRNPAALVEAWPKLWSAMAGVRRVLEQAWHDLPELRDLTSACGADPPVEGGAPPCKQVAGEGARRQVRRREPPGQDVIQELRRRLGRELGLDEDAVEAHHPASPWRYRMVQAVQETTGDPDRALGRWLEVGAPMGISQPIAPGGLFPEVVPEAGLTLQQLDELERWSANHPSFDKLHDEAEAPGVTTVRGFLDAGFGRLFADVADASKHCGVEIHPAPMGNITKELADGSLKHRPIQDLRRNGVNDAVKVPERQVLPRPIDHARDVAELSASCGAEDIVATLILDFKDAFMSIPLHEDEQPYNCTVLPGGVKLGRDPLDKNEVSEGSCIVWRVLGFGGKPNPLVYSRAASFAMRTGQVDHVAPNKGGGDSELSHSLLAGRLRSRLCFGSHCESRRWCCVGSCMWTTLRCVREALPTRSTRHLIFCWPGG